MKVTIGNVCFIQDVGARKVLLLKRNREPMQHLVTGVGGKTGFCEDIHASCIREVKEETGLDIIQPKLKGVVKTILDPGDSSWILFIYIADRFTGQLTPCDEGELYWVTYDQIGSQNLIGFIRIILPQVLFGDRFVEETIHHDYCGAVSGREQS